jgi:hypothetical protein
MSSAMLIGLMTTGFGLLTIAGIAVVLFRFRRLPIVWMIRSADRRVAFHRDAVATLASALTSARAEGRRREFDQLAESYRSHARALRSLDATAVIAPMPAFESPL